ncbi:dipeptide ABC transporter ATP-binding protein [Nocardioides flavescens]|uniref:Dipeptide ABC transporter ATP-binding protein n=1 Tax=Nocardioides flavescens TaxID=2691959 RepID=A0A6L7F2D0_9ACTN|nr:ABC transporter ATP-binding protein [Nocardioides flavescens]MXG90902.1 dipeptide ABC transporter ATP-binding protein [Nocardioides flavescens]
MAPQRRLSTPTSDSPAVQPLLRVRDLSVSYGGHQVVDRVSFDLPRGHSLALIGESGSGKSTIARSVLRLLPAGVGRATGTVELQGQDVLALPERHFRPLRGRTIGFVPQDPSSSLNPVRTIGSQAREASALLRDEAGHELDGAAQRQAVVDVLARVGLDDPERVLASYPHQLSGGMLQRVLIGLAVLPQPALIVADEPTSALDVTIQKRILDLLSELRDSLDISMLLITHDLAIAAERADSVVVLKGGTVQESGPTSQVSTAPTSAYAQRLHDDVPALNPDRYADLRAVGEARRADPASAPKIEVRGVTKRFSVHGQELTAVDDLSFAVPAGTTHAIVGESGSGKTTTIRLLLGLETPDSGEIVVAGERVDGRSHAELRSVRRHLQFVYQNPFTSLDPTWKVERLVREPLDRFRVGDKAGRREAVREALDAVGLDHALLARRPDALSGGQRQRVAIARALVLRPDVIVLDEPTSALDVSVQADIVQVLLRLQAELGLTYVFVSHDLALVRQLAHTVSVVRRGRVVEDGTVERIFDAPREDYTRTLLASIPDAGAARRPALAEQAS